MEFDVKADDIFYECEEEDKLQDLIREAQLKQNMQTSVYVAKETLGLTPLSTASTQPDSAVGPSSGRKYTLGIPLRADKNSKREILALPSIQLYVRLEAF